MQATRQAKVLFYNVAKQSNVGPMIRTAAAFGINEILVSGKNNAKSPRTKFGAKGTDKKMRFSYYDSFPAAVEELKKDGFHIMGVEIREDAIPVDEGPFDHDKIVFVFGNEGTGLNDTAVKACDSFVRIKQFSEKTASINVATSAGIVLHAWALWAGLNEAPIVKDKYSVLSHFRMLVGSYSTKMGHVDGKGEGVYTASVNAHTGAMSELQTVLKCPDASYLEILDNGDLLVVDEGGGTLTSYKKDKDTYNKVSQIDGGTYPCHVFSEDNIVTVSGYGGHLTQSKFDEERRLDDLKQVKVSDFLKASKVNKERQMEPHPHFFCNWNDEYGIFVDLGADCVCVVQIEGFKPVFPVLDVHGGPRHCVKHPFLENTGYVVTELSNEVVKFDLDFNNGVPKWNSEKPVSTLPSSVEGPANLAAVKIHPNGKYLFISNRFHDSVTSFELDEEGNVLKMVCNVSCFGKTPRDLAITPNGKVLLSANQDSSNISSFLIGEDGSLTYTNQPFPCPTPVCIRF